MRTAYNTLTSEEYDVLQLIASKTKMECWFSLKQDQNGADYVWDIEEGKQMCLKTGVELLVEGLDCKENYDNCRLNCFEDLTFRNLLSKLDIPFKIAFDGPSIKGMSKKELIEYCEKEGIKYKTHLDIVVGDKAFLFDSAEKCFHVVHLNLDKKTFLQPGGLLDKQISAAEEIVKKQSGLSAVQKKNDITR